ncbi:WD repeat-containing protein 36, partial [Coelomomyces lativittatus]
MSNHGFEGNFIQMMVFGEYLVALNDTANYLMVWLYGLGEVYTSLTFKKTVFDATCFLHPHTYLNKLLIGSIQGTMQLWNIKTNQLIYSFSSFKAPITCLAQSPIIDVIALGLQNGKVILHHLKLDETLFSFEQQSKVTAIAFRSDEHAIMATANEQGDIAIWDLSKKRLMHQLKNVHCCSINSMEFLVGQPILMTSAADNSIKQYLFDAPESEPRLLKSRSGHTQPPTLLRFYDEEGQYLLTSSKDRALRLVRVERDAEHIELSQGAVLKKSRKWKVAEESLRLSPILGLASNPLQQRDWDTIVTCHANDPV